jgi:PAS domain S-box-containing protein
MNILIVDDNEQNRYPLQVLLEFNGYTVVTAANGAEALEKARQSPPDLIITDILMPVMDGFSLCREWKRDERLRDIPLVFYTATYTDEKDRELALNLGAARFIVKPEGPETILRTIKAAIANQKHGTPAAPRKPIQDEAVFLKEHSEALIRKLEDKMEQLEQAHRELERDLTERKQVEGALRESEERLTKAFRSIPDALTISRLEDGKIVEVNNSWHKVFGYSREEVIGKSSLALNLFADSADRQRAIALIREQGFVHDFELQMRPKSGALRTAILSIELLEIQGEQYMLTVAQDLTERKQVEGALRESEQHYRTLVEAAPDVVYVITADGTLASLNPAFERISGWPRTDWIGKPFLPLIHPDDQALAMETLQQVLRGETPPVYRLRILSKTGDYLVGEFTSTPHIEQGRIVGELGIARDITERMRANEDLRASHEQLRALAAHLQTVREEERLGLARELHDELGQGLTALQIDLTWLDGQLRTVGPAELPALRDKVVAMVPRTEHLIETTQTISSSLRPGVLDDLGLVAAIEWLAADFEKRTGLACVAMLPADDITLDLARAVALFRIVQEAQTNVIRHAKASRVEVRLRVTGGELVLEVEDNGQGMALQQAADPKSLGLRSMRERAAVFGGTIDIQSEAGRGTILRVRMPQA